MASKQLNQMVELYASIKERASKPDLDLATIRDIVENLHLAATEPAAVTYAEVGHFLPHSIAVRFGRRCMVLLRKGLMASFPFSHLEVIPVRRCFTEGEFLLIIRIVDVNNLVRSGCDPFALLPCPFGPQLLADGQTLDEHASPEQPPVVDIVH